MKNKLDNLTIFLAIVSIIILPFLIIFGVKYDSLFFHYITL